MDIVIPGKIHKLNLNIISGQYFKKNTITLQKFNIASE